LYSIVSPTSYFSVYEWLKLVTKEINCIRTRGLQPILVGGSGLYFSSLIAGIARIPQATKALKQTIECLTKDKSNQDLHSMLIKYDNELAERLHTNDRLRVLRGLEVMIVTGQSITKWHQSNTKFFPRDHFINIYVKPNRDTLYRNINIRFLQMIELGVEYEVINITKKYSIDNLPKIIGLLTLYDYTKGRISFQDMVMIIQQNTRNYAKRQLTWFNNKLHHDYVISSESSL
jgi:tRNA dimethylallyltransferase